MGTESETVISHKVYIQSAAWREKRAAVLLRSKGVCERCRRWSVVNVHHLSYANLGDEPLTDLLGVCLKCHRELHRES